MDTRKSNLLVIHKKELLPQSMAVLDNIRKTLIEIASLGEENREVLELSGKHDSLNEFDMGISVHLKQTLKLYEEVKSIILESI